jgi:hypothetical protein
MSLSGLLAVWAAINWNAIGSVIAGLALVSAVHAADRSRRQQLAASLVKTKVVLILAQEATLLLRGTQFDIGNTAWKFAGPKLDRRTSQLDRIDEAGLPNDAVLVSLLELRDILAGVHDPVVTDMFQRAGVGTVWMHDASVRRLERVIEELKQHCRLLGAKESDDTISRSTSKTNDFDFPLSTFVSGVIYYISTPREAQLAEQKTQEVKAGVICLDLVLGYLAGITIARRSLLGVEEDIAQIADHLNAFGRWQNDVETPSSEAFPTDRVDALQSAFDRVTPLLTKPVA